MIKPALLRVLLIALLVLVQLVTMMTVIYGMRDSAAERFVVNSQGSLGRLADLVAAEIGDFLVPAKTAVELTVLMARDGGLKPGDEYAMQHYMLTQLRANPTFESLAFGYADGRLIGVRRQAASFVAETIPAPGPALQIFRTTSYSNDLAEIESHVFKAAVSADPRALPWQQGARSKPGLSWTEPYILQPGGRPGLTAAAILKDADGFEAGVFGIDMETAALSQHVGQIPAVQQGSAAMVDRAGHLIAFSGPTPIQDGRSAGNLPRVEDVAGTPLRALLEGYLQAGSKRDVELAVLEVEKTPITTPVKPDRNFVRFESAGYERIGLVMPVSVFGDRPSWLLIAQTPVTGMTTQLTALFEERLPTLGLLIILPGLLSVIGVLTLTAPLYKMHEQATVDKLTSALNRPAFERKVKRMGRARRELEAGLSIALIAFDLDSFKRINDNYGHGAGDAVLQAFVARLRTHLRRADLIGRLGGDEFMVAAWADQHQGPPLPIERVRRATAAEPFMAGKCELWVGVTAGMAWLEPGGDFHMAMAQADHALVAGKAMKKNRLYVVTDEGAVEAVTDSSASDQDG